MSIAVSIVVTPVSPNHGDTVTAKYVITGNDPVPPQSAAVSGAAMIGTQDYTVTTTITLPGDPALPESFSIPSCPGLTFSATSDPTVYTAVVP